MNFHTISIKYMIIYVDKKLATFQFIMKCSVVSRFILDIHFGSIQPFLSFLSTHIYSMPIVTGQRLAYSRTVSLAY